MSDLSPVINSKAQSLKASKGIDPTLHFNDDKQNPQNNKEENEQSEKKQKKVKTRLSSLYRNSQDKTNIEEHLNQSILAGKKEGEIFAQTIKIINNQGFQMAKVKQIDPLTDKNNGQILRLKMRSIIHSPKDHQISELKNDQKTRGNKIVLISKRQGYKTNQISILENISTDPQINQPNFPKTPQNANFFTSISAHDKHQNNTIRHVPLKTLMNTQNQYQHHPILNLEQENYLFSQTFPYNQTPQEQTIGNERIFDSKDTMTNIQRSPFQKGYIENMTHKTYMIGKKNIKPSHENPDLIGFKAAEQKTVETIVKAKLQVQKQNQIYYDLLKSDIQFESTVQNNNINQDQNSISTSNREQSSNFFQIRHRHRMSSHQKKNKTEDEIYKLINENNQLLSLNQNLEEDKDQTIIPKVKEENHNFKQDQMSPKSLVRQQKMKTMIQKQRKIFPFNPNKRASNDSAGVSPSNSKEVSRHDLLMKKAKFYQQSSPRFLSLISPSNNAPSSALSSIRNRTAANSILSSANRYQKQHSTIQGGYDSFLSQRVSEQVNSPQQEKISLHLQGDNIYQRDLSTRFTQRKLTNQKNQLPTSLTAQNSNNQNEEGQPEDQSDTSLTKGLHKKRMSTPNIQNWPEHYYKTTNQMMISKKDNLYNMPQLYTLQNALQSFNLAQALHIDQIKNPLKMLKSDIIYQQQSPTPQMSPPKQKPSPEIIKKSKTPLSRPIQTRPVSNNDVSQNQHTSQNKRYFKLPERCCQRTRLNQTTTANIGSRSKFQNSPSQNEYQENSLNQNISINQIIPQNPEIANGIYNNQRPLIMTRQQRANFMRYYQQRSILANQNYGPSSKQLSQESRTGSAHSPITRMNSIVVAARKTKNISRHSKLFGNHHKGDNSDLSAWLTQTPLESQHNFIDSNGRLGTANASQFLVKI